jgi:Asp-tRNA(Asn)/Glu-tRNA(Gln) amidotransferase A subunit family amidase
MIEPAVCVPRAGVKSLSEALDSVGGFGRSVRDVALLGAVLTGDARLIEAGAAVSPRIGLCGGPDVAQADADTQRAMAEAGAVLAPQAAAFAEAPLPGEMPDLVGLQKAVMAFDMARALSHERLCHRDRLSGRLRALFDEGVAIPGARHAAHLAQTADAQRRVDAMFDRFDVLLAPSASGEAPHGTDATGDPLFCRGWTLLGLPCIHLPFTTGKHGLPVGLQLVGRFGDDHRLLAVAQWVHERLTR